MIEVLKEKEIGNIEVKKMDRNWEERKNGIIYFFKILFCNLEHDE